MGTSGVSEMGDGGGLIGVLIVRQSDLFGAQYLGSLTKLPRCSSLDKLKSL